MGPFRLTATTALALLPGRVMGHPGHLADVGGHDHIIAAAALAIALVLGLGAWARDRYRARPDRQASRKRDTT